ncbi:MAG: IS4 family transposase [Erysipelotrichaceae bacterium]|nr:IS4 family transposase [Erysipelotrichaceae bacterium]
MNNSKQLQKKLNTAISIVSDSRSLFVMNPETDFTRDRSLNFETVLRNIICMESGSLKDELLKLNEHSLSTPTTSAFVQARSKIKHDAFKAVFDIFNRKTQMIKTYKGYRLLAIDGSVLPIDNSFIDKETTLLKFNQSDKSYSAFHMNASYDLLERTYDDLIIQGQAQMNENEAFFQLVDRYKGNKAIFIADRNYESFNGFEHVVQSGNKYLIRVKDIGSKTSITQSFGPFEDTEFDIDVSSLLTRRNTNHIKAHPEIYKFMPKNQRFDYFNDDLNIAYEFHSRIVRFKISEDSYECIMTNLDRNEFSSEEIKELYHKRWGIETSFRELKYAIGLSALHSKKRESIKQEIYARLLLYNFSQRIIQKIKIKKRKTKHTYQVNFTRAFHIVREFIRKKSGKPLPVESLIAKEILPIRPNRSNIRDLKHKGVVCFNYRFD